MNSLHLASVRVNVGEQHRVDALSLTTWEKTGALRRQRRALGGQKLEHHSHYLNEVVPEEFPAAATVLIEVLFGASLLIKSWCLYGFGEEFLLTVL